MNVKYMLNKCDHAMHEAAVKAFLLPFVIGKTDFFCSRLHMTI